MLFKSACDTTEEKISWIKTNNRHFTRKPKTRNYKNALIANCYDFPAYQFVIAGAQVKNLIFIKILFRRKT
jgi:hypothetical protein